MGFLVLKLLADRPETASWLTPEEAEALVRMRAAETHDRPKTRLLPALGDIRVLILALVQFGFTLGSYGIGIWLPLIMKDYRLSNLAIGFLAAIPYFFASAGMIAWAWHVDRTGKKIANLALACLLAVVGLGLYVFSGSLTVSLIDVTLALVGVTAARAIFWTIPPRFLTGVAAAGGIAFINTIGTMGGFFGPAMMGVMKDATGGFNLGILAMAGIMAVTTLLALSLKLVVRQE
jgi:nitrate/nitrite transporter NarK